MDAETRAFVDNGSEAKSLLLDGWKRGGSGRCGRLSCRNSVNSLRTDFISRLPDKVRSAADPEFLSLADLDRAQGLSKGFESEKGD